jgi:hypothetical protein
MQSRLHENGNQHVIEHFIKSCCHQRVARCFKGDTTIVISVADYDDIVLALALGLM